MAIDFDVIEHKPVPGPASTLVRVEFRPVSGEPVHSNVFHMQLYPTGRRLLVTAQGQLVTESGIIVPSLPDVAQAEDVFPPENPTDPYRHETFTRPNDAEMVKNIEAYWERKLRAAAEGHPYPQHHQSTVNLQVGAGGDDGFDKRPAATFDSTSDFVSFGTDTGGAGQQRLEFSRFLSVAIENADTIDTASLVYTGQFGESTSVELLIDGNDIDDAVAPTSTTEYGDLVRTTASVQWDFSTTWTDGSEFTSPELKTIIQEIVDRGSWATGNDMITFVRDDKNTDSDLRRSPYSYDGDTAKAPKLNIDFTGGAAATRRYTLTTLGVG